MRLTMNDATAFHGLLLASSDWQLARGGDLTHKVNSVYHRGQLLRLLRSQLNNQPTVVSDAIVASVLCLAGHEVSHSLLLLHKGLTNHVSFP